MMAGRATSVRMDCGGICIVRTPRIDDAEPLYAIANDWEIARYMRDLFPHPYAIEDARAWIERNASDDATHFVIEVDGRVAGGIGYVRFDAERRFSAVLGYWVARRFQGRGVATAAAGSVANLAFEREDIVRLEAGVYSNNPASMRVLEKCGFEREGSLRRDVVKGDEFLDRVMYARLRP